MVFRRLIALVALCSTSGIALAQTSSPATRASSVRAEMKMNAANAGTPPGEAKKAEYEVQKVLQEERFLRRRFGGQLPAADARRLNARLSEILARSSKPLQK